MAGVKGRSGRRVTRDEDKRMAILQKAWLLIEQSLDDPDVPKLTKIEMALKLAVKDIPTQISGSMPVTVTEMPTIRICEGEAQTPVNLEYSIGEQPRNPGDPEYPGEVAPPSQEF